MNTFLIVLWFISVIACCLMLLFVVVKKIRKMDAKKHWRKFLISLGINIVLFILALVTTCDHEYVVVSEVTPTCTEEGYIISICSICDFEHTEYIDELGHDMRITSAIEPTVYFSGEVVRTCAICGYEEVEEISNEDLIDLENEKLLDEQSSVDSESAEQESMQVELETTEDVRVVVGNEKEDETEQAEQEEVEENYISIVLDISDYIIDSRPITSDELVEQLGSPEYTDNWTWKNNGKSYPIESYGYGDFEFDFYEGILTRISNPFGSDIPYEEDYEFIKMFNLENPSGGESSNQYDVYWAYECGIVRTFRVLFDSSDSMITDVMITFSDIYE